MTYETLAFFAAATNAGRSCVSQRTDDFGSGSRKQRSALPCAALSVFANAPPTVVLMTTAATANTTMNLFTPLPSSSRRIPGGRYRFRFPSSTDADVDDAVRGDVRQAGHGAVRELDAQLSYLRRVAESEVDARILGREVAAAGLHLS